VAGSLGGAYPPLPQNCCPANNLRIYAVRSYHGGMFGRSREYLEVLQGGRQALQAIADVLAASLDGRGDAGKLAERLEDLELTRAKWEAEISAELLKADSRYKAAAAAESRARTQKAFNAKSEAVEGDADGPEAVEEPSYENFPWPDGAPGPENGLLEVPVRLESRGRKTSALISKFSRR